MKKTWFGFVAWAVLSLVAVNFMACGAEDNSNSVNADTADDSNPDLEEMADQYLVGQPRSGDPANPR